MPPLEDPLLVVLPVEVGGPARGELIGDGTAGGDEPAGGGELTGDGSFGAGSSGGGILGGFPDGRVPDGRVPDGGFTGGGTYLLYLDDLLGIENADKAKQATDTKMVILRRIERMLSANWLNTVPAAGILMNGN